MFKTVLVAAAAVVVASAARAAPLDELIASERAFDAYTHEVGVTKGFQRYSAPGAVVFRPGPVDAQEWLARSNPRGPGAPELRWWPVHAGIARSGDLGFTTGPYTVAGKPGGWFLTIWKRQPDGQWKWLLDHGGPGASDVATEGPGAPVVALAMAVRGEGSASAALSKVQALEAKWAKAAAGDLGGAYAGLLAEDAWMSGLEPRPAAAPDQVKAALAKRPSKVATQALGGGASRAGDLVFTYGTARWTTDSKSATGEYVHVWQMRKGGFRLVFDELTAD